jgi:hypothetical protein
MSQAHFLAWEKGQSIWIMAPGRYCHTELTALGDVAIDAAFGTS